MADESGGNSALAMGPFVVYDLLTVMDYGYPYELNILIDNQDQAASYDYELCNEDAQMQ